MLASEAITQFELQVDDTSELSSSEELSLLNDVIQSTGFSRTWNILKTSASGTVVANEITLPADFAYIYANRNWASNAVESQKPVIFIGTEYKPYVVLNFDERRQYRNSQGYAYLDMANNKIIFNQTPESSTYEFDYIKTVAEVGLADELPFPARFHKKFVHDMAMLDNIIQMSDKAGNNIEANRAESMRYQNAMNMWDSKLTIL